MKYLSPFLLVLGILLNCSCNESDEDLGGSQFSLLDLCENDYAEFLINDTSYSTMQMPDGGEFTNSDGVACGIVAALNETENIVTLRIQSGVHHLSIKTKTTNLNENVANFDFTVITYTNTELERTFTELVEDHPTKLTITELESSTRTISGEFNFGIIDETINTASNDIFDFTEGTFTCIYQGF